MLGMTLQLCFACFSFSIINTQSFSALLCKQERLVYARSAYAQVLFAKHDGFLFYDHLEKKIMLFPLAKL
ncbi:unnamed protein product [Ixodes pacificus]